MINNAEFKQEDIIEIILNYLKENNLNESYCKLIKESKIVPNVEISNLKKLNKENKIMNLVLNGNWIELIKNIEINILSDEVNSEVFKQIINELIHIDNNIELAKDFYYGYIVSTLPYKYLLQIKNIILNYKSNNIQNNNKNKDNIVLNRNKIANFINKEINDLNYSKISNNYLSKDSNLINYLVKAYNYDNKIHKDNTYINKNNISNENISNLNNNNNTYSTNVNNKFITKIKFTKNYNNLINLKENEHITCMSISNTNDIKNKLIALSTNRGYIKIIELNNLILNKECYFNYNYIEDEINNFNNDGSIDKNSIDIVKISSDNKIIAVATSVYFNILVLKMPSFKEAKNNQIKQLRIFKNIHNRTISSILISSDNSFIVSASKDSYIRILGLKTCNILCEYNYHSYSINTQYLLNNNYLISGDKEGYICCIDLVANNLEKKIDTFNLSNNILKSKLLYNNVLTSDNFINKNVIQNEDYYNTFNKGILYICNIEYIKDFICVVNKKSLLIINYKLSCIMKMLYFEDNYSLDYFKYIHNNNYAICIYNENQLSLLNLQNIISNINESKEVISFSNIKNNLILDSINTNNLLINDNLFIIKVTNSFMLLIDNQNTLNIYSFD